MRNNPTQVIDPDDEFIPCNDCYDPDHCSTRCAIAEYWLENTNIAKQRGETPDQLWGETK